MTLAERAFERLHVWPDLRTGHPSCGTGRALRTVHGEIAHFHSDRDVDLHLTGSAIERFAGDLRGSTAIRLVPGSRWVTVHLDCDTDVDLLLSLTSMALKAHQGQRGVPAAGCNFRRVTVVPRDVPA
ncbi:MULTISPECIES: luciferase family protein [unclassified Streptomyces]|uniref:luciferase domain-containing protein n=1 Tax=unclassified Streptomyces TaxID=2593676 RepID=UPI0036E9F588